MTRTVFGSDTVASLGHHIDSVLLVVAVVVLVLALGMAAIARPARRPPVVAPPTARKMCDGCRSEKCAIWGCQK